MDDRLASLGDCDVTRLPQGTPGERGRSLRELYESVYDELHRIAEAHMVGEGPDEALQPTALVSESWLRLLPAAERGVAYRDQEHFLSVASCAMRSALLDLARRRISAKRGGNHERVPLEVARDLVADSGFELLALHDALERLALDEPRQSRVVELRFFDGLTQPQVASVLGVSRATVDRAWRLARIWLREELRTESA